MIEKLRDKIIKYGKIAGKRGLTPGFSGNMSARIDDKILITATGSANGFLKDDDISLISFDGELVSGLKRPSSEKFLHIKFYEQRSDINAILHFHSPYLTSFAAAGVGLSENILPEIVYCFDNIPIAAYALPGSMELVNNTAKYFKDHDVVLMQNHGVIVGGNSIKDAFLKLEICEAYAKSVICAKFLGGAKILTDDEVQKIYNLRV